MVAPFPELDRRRASELYRELTAIASVMVPEWRGAALEGEFGQALLRIAARLGAEVTRRIDQTPNRDALAFFNMLDVPAEAPRPAAAPLVFLLAEKRNAPVFAPAGVQVGASTGDGEVLFETREALKLTPARLTFLAAADGDSDTIEEAPRKFLDLAPPAGPLPDFATASFARAGSVTLQIAPSEGLEPGDMIRVDGTVYRIAEGKDGLFTLHDKLEGDVPSNTPVEKVTRFDAFDLRNLQQHALYIGHAELLNLEEPSTILVSFEPEGVAQQLADSAIRWELYGTDQNGKSDWHPLVAVAGAAGQLELVKLWRGSVDETKVNGQDGRWLRARHADAILAPVVPGTRTRRITIGVRTGGEAPQPAAGAGAACDGGKGTSAADAAAATASAQTPENVEGSHTIDQAFHNTNPLPLTTRFLPFGPEPQRFDTFALAAPEAFSKKGAAVRLKVTLPDAGLAAMDVPMHTDGPARAYAIANNGRLQGLAFKDPVIWQELGQPEPDDVTDAEVTLRDLELDAKTSPQAVQLAPFVLDRVVARDRQGRFWAGTVRPPTVTDDEFTGLKWKELTAIPGDEGAIDIVLLRAGNPASPPGFYALVLSIADGALYRLELVAVGNRDWTEVQALDENNQPAFGPNCRMVPVRAADWPAPPADFPIEIVVLDEDQKLWRGAIASDENTKVDWVSLDAANMDTPSSAVRPAAARLADDRLVVFAATEDNGIHKPFVFVDDPPNPTATVPAAGAVALAPGSAIQLYPGGFGSEPLAVGFGKENEQSAITLWTSQGNKAEMTLPADLDIAGAPRGMIVPVDGLPVVVINGGTENLHRVTLPLPVQFALFHALVFGNVVPNIDFIEPVLPSGTRAVVGFPAAPVINSGGNVIYAFDPNDPQLGGEEPGVGSWSLWRGDAVLQGTVANLPRKLTPDANHATIAAGDILMIGGQPYTVSSYDSGTNIATLDGALPGSPNAGDSVAYSVGDFTGTVANPPRELTPDGSHQTIAQNDVLVIDGQPYTVTAYDSGTNIATLDNDLPGPPSVGDSVAYSVGDFSGTVPNLPSGLTPDGSQTKAPNDVLVIGGKRYTVTFFDSGADVATLDDDLPGNVGDIVDYTPVVPAAPANVQVQPQHLKTLVKVSGISAVPSPPKLLRFASPGTSPDPAVQAISLFQQSGGDSWVLLASAWAQAPDAAATAELAVVESGQWLSTAFPRGYQNPELAWEYFDGSSWRRLNLVSDETENFARSGDIEFKVPRDLQPGEVAGQEDYWIRARLIGGDYGRAQYIVESKPVSSTTTEQKVTVDTSDLKPPEIINIEVLFEFLEKVPAERVLVTNNLDFRDQTQASAVPDAEFELYEGVRKINDAGSDDETTDVEKTGVEKTKGEKTCDKKAECEKTVDENANDGETQTGDARAQRVLYFGFTKRFDVRPLSMFVDAEDQEGRGVELDFEVLTRTGWRRISADDGTRGFHRRGFVQITVDTEPRKARLFGRELHWLRVRPHVPSESWAPRLRSVFVNAGLAEQAKTITQELLGSSMGEPGLRLALSSQPVLPDSLELRVRESLTDEDREALNAGQDNLPEEDRKVTQYKDLSLPGDWVLWDRVDSFIGHGPDARVYRLDSARGEVTFGEETGTPPAGRDNIRAIRYQAGGGKIGNLGAYTVAGLKSAVEAVEMVANPVPAAGGTDTPSIEAQITGAPARLRRGEQALTPPDIEALAVSTSPDIVRARCLFPASPGAPIRLAIAMRTGERCPRPSLADREALANIVREEAWGGLGKDDIRVIIPDYVRTRLRVRLRPTSTEEAAALEQAAAVRLRLLLHPVDGGPAGNGWPFAQRIWESDVFRALDDLPGFDRVEDIALAPVGDDEAFENMSPVALVCAEEDDIRVIVESGDGGS